MIVVLIGLNIRPGYFFDLLPPPSFLITNQTAGSRKSLDDYQIGNG